ncbi:uncharacterized protein C2orf81 homolog isoform X2 [Dendronephthya gigantea]|uniref:uncharacterized protein C2orf81 homolog isoform X2 n=1 Tax=Dendronephthya gigantea TaxID=151771 RepID=UPI00106AA658|nr:uncharacterized protein C2orf81 homolog isoform X2 [Dendronephthya gigantea]
MSKFRNEKKPPSQPPPVTTTNDIIPGKFNENQWNSMVEEESSQDFILDLLDEILDCTVQVIHDKYIQSQLQPYSVHAAKDLLLQIIESRFLEHDLGEVSPANDVTWLEDEEPIPCVTDSWSQGSVPVQRCQSRPLSARCESRTLTRSCSESNSLENSPSEGVESYEDRNEVEPEAERNETTQESCETEIPPPLEVVPSPPPTSRVVSPGRRKHVVKTTKKTTQSERKKSKTQVVEQRASQADPVENTGSMKPVQQIRTSRAPPGEQEVTYDEQGNIVAMMRFSVDKLPTHRIRPRFGILDPQTDPIHPLSTQPGRKGTKKDATLSRQGRLADVRRKREVIQTFKSPSMKSNMSLEITEDSEVVKPLPPPLSDSMEISAGVIVREGDIVRKGPKTIPAGRQKSPTDILNLQPVGSLAKRQTISVSDVIGNTSPVIRQMRIHEPIPPIAHRG